MEGSHQSPSAAGDDAARRRRAVTSPLMSWVRRSTVRGYPVSLGRARRLSRDLSVRRVIERMAHAGDGAQPTLLSGGDEALGRRRKRLAIERVFVRVLAAGRDSFQSWQGDGMNLAGGVFEVDGFRVGQDFPPAAR